LVELGRVEGRGGGTASGCVSHHAAGRGLCGWQQMLLLVGLLATGLEKRKRLVQVQVLVLKLELELELELELGKMLGLGSRLRLGCLV
jgi:hypothetical protein